MRHIIFKITGNIPGYIRVVGSYMNYYYGRIDDIYDDMRLELDKLNASVITEEEGKGFIFADIYKDYISIRTNSSLMDEVPVLAESSETDEIKNYLEKDVLEDSITRFDKPRNKKRRKSKNRPRNNQKTKS